MAAVSSPVGLAMLPMRLVTPDPDQPRKVFPKDHIEQIAASILEHGQLQPIRVRKVEKKFIIIVGECRWRAHRLLDMPQIRAEVVEGLDAGQVFDEQIIENLQRANVEPLEEARAFRRRGDETKEDAVGLAKRFGVKPRYVLERLSLLNLAPEMQEALSCKIIFLTQAIQMARLHPDSQKVLFDAIGRGRCRTQEELYMTTQKLIDAENQTEMFARPTRAEQDFLANIEMRVQRLAQAVQLFEAEVKPEAITKLNPLRADVLAKELDIMERALKRVRLAILAAGV